MHNSPGFSSDLYCSTRVPAGSPRVSVRDAVEIDASGPRRFPQTARKGAGNGPTKVRICRAHQSWLGVLTCLWSGARGWSIRRRRYRLAKAPGKLGPPEQRLRGRGARDGESGRRRGRLGPSIPMQCEEADRNAVRPTRTSARQPGRPLSRARRARIRQSARRPTVRPEPRRTSAGRARRHRTTGSS